MRLSRVVFAVLLAAAGAVASLAAAESVAAQDKPMPPSGDSALQAFEQRARALAQPDTPAARARSRAAALNAVFSFREDLLNASTKIAECTVADALRDTGAVRVVESRFRALFTRTASESCGVGGFMRDTARVLWIESLTDVTRSGSQEAAARPYSIEITVQLLHGPGYREFAEYLLRPSGDAWRVIRYELTGMQFIHDHSMSSVRP